MRNCVLVKVWDVGFRVKQIAVTSMVSLLVGCRALRLYGAHRRPMVALTT